jgi:L-ascorbate metabolism protein UlaG (beta-lactamase superfamily)
MKRRVGMKITYMAHACFYIETSEGVGIIVDPYQPGSFGNALRYEPIGMRANIVLVTHEHADHNATDQVMGNPEIVKGPGKWEIMGIKVNGIETFHDENRGADRGKNTVFLIEAEGLRLVHLGDLGHSLTEREKEELGKVDVLFTPVGGFFTIGPEEAWNIVELLDPKIVIPMHYKTPKVDFPISPLDEFLRGRSGIRKFGSEVEVQLPAEREIWVLTPSRL